MLTIYILCSFFGSTGYSGCLNINIIHYSDLCRIFERKSYTWRVVAVGKQLWVVIM